MADSRNRTTTTYTWNIVIGNTYNTDYIKIKNLSDIIHVKV